MKKKKYLPLYCDWMEDGLLPARGLCHSIGDPVTSVVDPMRVVFTNKDLALFTPDDDCYPSYWGHGGADCYNLMFGFTPLRQNIVLFLAAMNNEL